MRFLILGDGVEENAWADAISAHPGHTVQARWTATAERIAEGEAAIDSALADPTIEAVVVGGPLGQRGDWLQRVAMRGLPAICLHPPGDPIDDPYYRVAVAHADSAPLVVPAIALRLHPAIQTFRKRLQSAADGTSHRLRLEVRLPQPDNLVMNQFARVVDTVLFLLGACDSITATGWPRGENPTERLAVIATSPAGAAEIDIDLDPGTHIRASLSLLMDHNKIICTWIDDFGGPSKLDAAADAGPLVYDAWDGRRALLDAFDLAHRGQASDVPLLQDGIRAMDLTEGVRRSLRRGRTVAVLNEDMGELSGFKSNMASLGCCVILLSLTLYLISRVGLALGIAPLGYLAWLIVPMLVLFGLLQFLRLAARPAKQSGGPKSPAS